MNRIKQAFESIELGDHAKTRIKARAANGKTPLSARSIWRGVAMTCIALAFLAGGGLFVKTLIQTPANPAGMVEPTKCVASMRIFPESDEIGWKYGNNSYIDGTWFVWKEGKLSIGDRVIEENIRAFSNGQIVFADLTGDGSAEVIYAHGAGLSDSFAAYDQKNGKKYELEIPEGEKGEYHLIPAVYDGKIYVSKPSVMSSSLAVNEYFTPVIKSGRLELERVDFYEVTYDLKLSENGSTRELDGCRRGFPEHFERNSENLSDMIFLEATFESITAYPLQGMIILYNEDHTEFGVVLTATIPGLTADTAQLIYTYNAAENRVSNINLEGCKLPNGSGYAMNYNEHSLRATGNYIYEQVILPIFNTPPSTMPSRDPPQNVRKLFDISDADSPDILTKRVEFDVPEFPDVKFTLGGTSFIADGKVLFENMFVSNIYLADVTGDGIPDFCATVSVGSGIVDDRVIVYDYAERKKYELAARMVYDYSLSVEMGKLVVTRKGTSIDSWNLQIVNGVFEGSEPQPMKIERVERLADFGDDAIYLVVPRDNSNSPDNAEYYAHYCSIAIVNEESGETKWMGEYLSPYFHASMGAYFLTTINGEQYITSYSEGGNTGLLFLRISLNNPESLRGEQVTLKDFQYSESEISENPDKINGYIAEINDILKDSKLLLSSIPEMEQSLKGEYSKIGTEFFLFSAASATYHLSPIT